jgi:hypothetical protein
MIWSLHCCVTCKNMHWWNCSTCRPIAKINKTKARVHANAPMPNSCPISLKQLASCKAVLEPIESHMVAYDHAGIPYT